MPTTKAWTMNCVLAGAKVERLIQDGQLAEALEVLKNLTSELEPQDVECLLRRIEGKV